MVHRCLGQKTRKRGRSRYKQEKEEEEGETEALAQWRWGVRRGLSVEGSLKGCGAEVWEGSLDWRGQDQAQMPSDGLPLVSCSGGRVAERGNLASRP